MTTRDRASFLSAGAEGALADAEFWTRTWMPAEVHTAVFWRLRASSGVTGRANSAVPREPTDVSPAAFSELELYYRSRGLAPRVQLPQRDEFRAFDEALAERGYLTESTTLVQMLDLRTEGGRDQVTSAAPLSGTDSLETFSISAAVTPEWVAAYSDGEGAETEHASRERLRILERTPSYYLDVRIGGQIYGVARINLEHDLAALSCMSVPPRARGKGFATRLLAVVIAEAVRLGATRIALQVGESNAPACRLYASAGFKTIDTYHYRVGPLS